MNSVDEKNWEEFRNTGLLWFINSILHLFGWAICYEYDNGKLLRCYPARVRFRGFDEKSNSEGYVKVSEYLRDNIDNLTEEAKE